MGGQPSSKGLLVFQLNLKGSDISGRPGCAGYRIVFRCTIASFPKVQETLQVVGGVSVASELGSPLGFAHQTHQCVMPADTSEARMELALDLSQQQVEVLEAQRAGRQLTLIFDPAFHIFGQSFAQQPSVNQARCFIHPNDWTRILTEAQYGDSLIFVVPLTDPDVAQATAKLRAAENAIQSGRYDDACTNIRKVVEMFWRAPDGSSSPGSKGRSAGKDDRVAAMADALYFLTSAANHADAPTRDITWTREDARLALGVAFVLLSHRASARETFSRSTGILPGEDDARSSAVEREDEPPSTDGAPTSAQPAAPPVDES